MLLYYLFWMFMGFTLHFYIILGTNLLTGGPARIAVFYLYQCFKEKEYHSESKQNETFGSGLFGTNATPGTWDGSQATSEAVTRVSVCPLGVGAPPPSWAPRASTDLLLPPIYIHVPRKHPGALRKTISTATTFRIREIPSWSLRRRPTGGGIDHGGPLHHLQGLSDEL